MVFEKNGQAVHFGCTVLFEESTDSNTVDKNDYEYLAASSDRTAGSFLNNTARVYKLIEWANVDKGRV